MCESVGKSGTVDEEKFTKFTCNVRSGLSDLSKCTRGNGMYVSTTTSVSLQEYVTYRTEFCARFHKTFERFSEDDERSSPDCENEAVYALPKDTENKDTHKWPPTAEDFPNPIRFDPDFCSKDVALASPRLSNETLLSWLRENKLSWFSFYNDLEQYLKLYSTEVLNQVSLDFADYLSISDLTEEEERIIEISRQAFLEYTRKQPLMIEGEEVVSETESEYQGPETIASQPLLSEERKQEIQASRRAIRQRAKRIAAKE